MAVAPHRPHGVGLRGLSLARGSPNFNGPFGRMFRAQPAADYGADDSASEKALRALADAMAVDDQEEPKDGPDSEEGGIPAAYTYFGQFIDHDLTFDPASSLQRQNDPDALVDYRTPRFDLDNVYGRGPDDQPYLYEDGRSFILGAPLAGAASNPRARDMPRSEPVDKRNDRRAIIGDPRNDENVIVSQLQGLVLRLHNKLAADNRDATFADIQRAVRFHYQWVVLNDYLPTIIDVGVLRDVLPCRDGGAPVRPNLQFYKPRNEAFMPLEFAAAAYRFGHSMVRTGYRLNEKIGPLPIFSNDPKKALTGFRKLPDGWAIDWNLFIDLEKRDPNDATRTQLAYRIDTSLATPLRHLPKPVGQSMPNLAERNLLRGWRMRLPTGQAVARAMGLQPLADEDILIGKFSVKNSTEKLRPITDFGGSTGPFVGNCPLWTYVLAETVEVDVQIETTEGPITIKTRKLGPVGGRIVAETFVGLLVYDSQSYLNQDPLWKPSLTKDGHFGLRELICAALAG